jgi:hypothetical protein
MVRRQRRRRRPKAAATPGSAKSRAKAVRGWLPPTRRDHDDQLNWSVVNGVPYRLDLHGRMKHGYTDFSTDKMPVRARYKSLTYATAFVAGIIWFRPRKGDLSSNDYRLLTRLDRGRFTLSVDISRFNRGLIRRIARIGKVSPSNVETIYGASFTSLCRRPTFEFNSRIGTGMAVQQLCRTEKSWSQHYADPDNKSSLRKLSTVCNLVACRVPKNKLSLFDCQNVLKCLEKA